MSLSTVVRITETPNQCGKSFAFMRMAIGFAQGGVRPVVWLEPTLDHARDRVRRFPEFQMSRSGVLCLSLGMIPNNLDRLGIAELVIFDNWHMVEYKERRLVIDEFERGSAIKAPRMMFLLG